MPRSLVLAAVAVLASAATASAFDVTACYQTVPSHETGILRVDLVCDGTGGPDVTLGRGARLEMGGHSISGGSIGVATDPGSSKAEIVGPGEISGADGDPFGCGIAPSSRVVVQNVSLHDNRRGIVSVYDFPMDLDTVTIVDNAVEGIASYFGNLGSPIGPGNGLITGRNLTITGNGDDGIEAYGRLDLRESDVSDNGAAGIVSQGRTYTLQHVTVTNNATAGIVSTARRPGKLKISTATGNGSGGDIAATIAPRLIASTCDHSVNTEFGGSLHICTGD
jgi:hypothetical protein